MEWSKLGEMVGATLHDPPSAPHFPPSTGYLALPRGSREPPSVLQISPPPLPPYVCIPHPNSHPQSPYCLAAFAYLLLVTKSKERILQNGRVYEMDWIGWGRGGGVNRMLSSLVILPVPFPIFSSD